MLLLAGLPLVSRSGLALEMAASGLLWLLWSLAHCPDASVRSADGCC